MDYLTLEGGVKMPMVGYGVFQHPRGILDAPIRFGVFFALRKDGGPQLL